MASLAALRRRRLLSQRALARRAGVAPSSVHMIETGKSIPQLVVMRKIVDALELTDPTEVDEFRRVLADGDDAPDEPGAAVPDAASDPVLADLWDNPDDAVYDDLVAASVPRAPA
jgi:transcriptional regulator with XRE-family HTH domain